MLHRSVLGFCMMSRTPQVPDFYGDVAEPIFAVACRRSEIAHFPLDILSPVSVGMCEYCKPSRTDLPTELM